MKVSRRQYRDPELDFQDNKNESMPGTSHSGELAKIVKENLTLTETNEFDQDLSGECGTSRLNLNGIVHENDALVEEASGIDESDRNSIESHQDRFCEYEEDQLWVSDDSDSDISSLEDIVNTLDTSDDDCSVQSNPSHTKDPCSDADIDENDSEMYFESNKDMVRIIQFTGQSEQLVLNSTICTSSIQNNMY